MSIEDKGSQPFDISNVRDILTVIFKHKYLILITFIVVLAITVAGTLRMHEQYEAKSVMLVKFGGREFVLRPEEMPRSGSATSVPAHAIINGEISILTSRDLLERVSLETGTSMDTLEKRLKVGGLPASNLIQVSFTDSDPVRAATVVNLLTDLYKQKHLEVFSGDGNEYLEKQLETSRKKLSQAQDNLSGFRQKYRVFSPEGQNTQLISQVGSLETNLMAAQNQIYELEQKIAFVRSSKWTGDNSPEIRTQLSSLQAKERELLGKYRENSTTIQNVRREIQTLKDSIRGSSQELRQAEISKVENELGIARAKADNLKRQVGQVQGQLQALNVHGRELQQLTRDVALNEQEYQVTARKLEESMAMEDMDRRKMVAVKMVEKASVPSKPKKPKLGRRQIAAGGFFGGIVAGVALAFFLELTSACMTTPYSAERRLGLPVMVAIMKK